MQKFKATIKDTYKKSEVLIREVEEQVFENNDINVRVIEEIVLGVSKMLVVLDEILEEEMKNRIKNNLKDMLDGCEKGDYVLIRDSLKYNISIFLSQLLETLE